MSVAAVSGFVAVASSPRAEEGAMRSDGPPGSAAERSAPYWNDAEAERVLLRLKDQLALDAQRETLASNVSAASHRVGMAVIGNCKA